MKPHSSNRYTLALAVLCSTIALTGCQTMGENASKKSLIGGVAGCLGGAALAAALGEAPAKGCAVGAAVGVASGYYLGRQKDMELALKAQEAIQRTQSGAKVEIITKRQDVPEAERNQVGGANSIDVVDAMVVNVPQGLVSKQDPRAVQTLGQIGGYVSESQTPSRIIVKTRTKQEYDFMVTNIEKGYTRETQPPKVAYEYEQVARSTQARVEVRHAA